LACQDLVVTVVERTRRTEILDAAALLFATRGIRTSLRDIADACGILPGSLYHHFDSKEAIVVELVQQYVAALDEVAAAPLTTIEELGTAIAACAVRHRAALLLTFFEPPSVFGTELADLAARSLVAVTDAMHELVTRVEGQGHLREGVDSHALADRLCQTMLHVGIGLFHRQKAAQQVPALKCRMLLQGLASRLPTDVELDRSPARAAADEVIAAWPPRDADGGDRSGPVLSAARAAFARRGYEATTIRDVASEAGTSVKAVYRLVPSKQDLFAAILDDYVTSLTEGWSAVLRSDALPLEKLDALLWLDINILDRFSEEHKIQSVSLRCSPPSSPAVGLSLPSQLRQIDALLSAAESAGDLRRYPATPDVRARCVFSLIWTPEQAIRLLGPRPALHLARSTLLRGATIP
jgi:AcrR family transcriptional regulator